MHPANPVASCTTTSFLDSIAVLVLTYDEEANIERTLDALVRFPEIVLVDSDSGDRTRDIAERYANVRVIKSRFESHASQWNFGLENCGIERPWVLALDADYVLPGRLVDEIAVLTPADDISGYRIGFRYCVFGRPLSASLYPPLVALYRRSRTRYVQQGHTQRAVVDGRIAELTGRIDHDDRKPLARWFTSQRNYARLEAEHLLSTPRGGLRPVDRMRLAAWPMPILVFVYTLLVKRCLLDGWPGWVYALQRTLAEMLISLEIVDRRLRHRHSSAAPRPHAGRP